MPPVCRAICRAAVTKLWLNAFAGGAIERVVVPFGVTEIGDSAFSCCNSITAIELPEGLEKIGAYAFCGCEGLKEIKLPSGLKVIGEMAFTGCKGLGEVTVPPSVTEMHLNSFPKEVKVIS